MDHTFCPGSKILRQPAPEFFDCPTCKYEVEIWTDELKAACPKCQTPVYRDTAMSCLDWCKRGKECVGDSAYSNYMQNKAVGVKSNLLRKIRDHFADELRRVERIESVLETAEALLKGEEGDWNIVVPASILRDMLDSDEGSPKLVRDILFRLGLNLEDIDEICEIMSDHRPVDWTPTINFRIWHDANALVDLDEMVDSETEEPDDGAFGEMFLTETGKDLALSRIEGSSPHVDRSIVMNTLNGSSS